jgi:adenosylcobinamide-GDP ribazoletransferase
MRARWDEFRLAVMLLTRLPVGRLRDPLPAMGSAAWAFPLAGLLAALAPAVVIWLTLPHLPPLMAALLALMVGLWVTGGLHEDGLADLADGLGGGATRARKLEIMRDSRIGSYGGLALVLSIGLRATGLAAAPDAITAALAVLAIGAASRAGLPLILTFQPPARDDGLGAAARSAGRLAAFVALALGTAVLAFLGGAGIAAGAAMALMGAALTALCQRQLGGYSGDTLGATQQICEVAGWIALAACWNA